MFSVCYRLNIYIHFRQISQSSVSHRRDPGSVPGQYTWSLWWADRYRDRSFAKQFSFFCRYRPLFVIDSEDTYLHCMLTTLCTQIWTCFIMKSFIKQRSIQNCSQYANRILHFCASVTNYHSCVLTITCHYFIRHILSETLTLCNTPLLLIMLIVFIYTM